MAAKDPLSRYFEAAVGLTDLTRKRAEQLVRNVLDQRQTAGNPKELVENLLERSNENRDALIILIRGETKRAIKAMGVATTNDVERLEQQVKALRRQLAEAQEQSASQSGTNTTRTTNEATDENAKKTTNKTSS